MTQATQFSKQRHIILILLLLLVGLMVVGCGTAVSPEDTLESSQLPGLEPAAVALVATEEPVDEPEPMQSEIMETPEPNNCLDCHTEKEMLIDTADPEEEVINESEGEG